MPALLRFPTLLRLALLLTLLPAVALADVTGPAHVFDGDTIEIAGERIPPSRHRRAGERVEMPAPGPRPGIAIWWGGSSRNTGRHLHFEVHFDDRPLDR